MEFARSPGMSVELAGYIRMKGRMYPDRPTVELPEIPHLWSSVVIRRLIWDSGTGAKGGGGGGSLELDIVNARPLPMDERVWLHA